ncbi:hypothetical protein ATO5_15305 [Loktanella sp. 22II-4b]|nr:hypothetical protein ATO5_15305 [Loktanella sp. 22II-4b]
MRVSPPRVLPIFLGGLRSRRPRSLDDLVEFTAIQPDTPALRAIVDFDTAALGNYQCFTVYGTLHAFYSCVTSILKGSKHFQQDSNARRLIIARAARSVRLRRSKDNRGFELSPVS